MSEYHLAPCRQREPGLTHVRKGSAFPTTCLYCFSALSEFYTSPVVETPAVPDVPSELPERGMKIVGVCWVDGRFTGLYLEPLGPDELNPPEGEPLPGPCQVGRHAADRTWLIPRTAELACVTHLREVLRRAAWPWPMAPLE